MHPTFEGGHHDFQIRSKVERLSMNVLDSGSCDHTAPRGENTDVRAAVLDLSERVQPANRSEHRASDGMRNQDRAYAVINMARERHVTRGRVDIHEDRALLDLHGETRKASSRGIDAAAGADVILPVVGGAGSTAPDNRPLLRATPRWAHRFSYA